MTLNAPVEFKTPRIRLRKPLLADAGAMFTAYASDPEVPRYMSWSAHQSPDETREYLQACLDEWAAGSGYPYVIVIGDSGPVGTIHLNRGPQHGVQFGYVLARPFWGHGYMTEALSTVVDWALTQPDVWRASAFCDVEHVASARVMEKAGLTFEGVLRRYFIHPQISPEPRDCKLYAKVRG